MPSIRYTICRSAAEAESLRAKWEALYAPESHSAFQSFSWNLLAARVFESREEPYIVCAESANGIAVVPAAFSGCTKRLRLLGEELFDYRAPLFAGDEEVLRAALAELSAPGADLEILAVRNGDLGRLPEYLAQQPFTSAPQVQTANTSSEAFAAGHTRLARNLRRLRHLGYEVRSYDGSCSPLVKLIYERKAAQEHASLFNDPLRVRFMVALAAAEPRRFEIFTLESEENVGAAVLTFRDGDWRRFYTVWFSPHLAQHSPGVSLIYEVTRRSLESGLDCDFMTGEQDYKLRLATRLEPLYRLSATREELLDLRRRAEAGIPLAA